VAVATHLADKGALARLDHESVGGPAELAPELHGHERFQHGAGVLACAAQASGRGAEKVGGQAAVDDEHLRRVDDSRRSAR
jgi:hypothetical protein